MEIGTARRNNSQELDMFIEMYSEVMKKIGFIYQDVYYCKSIELDEKGFFKIISRKPLTYKEDRGVKLLDPENYDEWNYNMYFPIEASLDWNMLHKIWEVIKKETQTEQTKRTLYSIKKAITDGNIQRVLEVMYYYCKQQEKK